MIIQSVGKILIFMKIQKESTLDVKYACRDLSALEEVLKEGRGSLLLKHNSTNNKINKFIKSLPKLMVSSFSDFKTEGSRCYSYMELSEIFFFL